MADKITFTLDAGMEGFVRACLKAHESLGKVEGGGKALTKAVENMAAKLDDGEKKLDKKRQTAEKTGGKPSPPRSRRSTASSSRSSMKRNVRPRPRWPR
ncbi:MAG: hypothetical protein AB1716_11370 [Planctomycetota bacterium]